MFVTASTAHASFEVNVEGGLVALRQPILVRSYWSLSDWLPCLGL